MALTFWTEQEFIKKDYRQTKLPKGDYENCRFVDSLFSEGYLDNQNFVECTFEGCDFTNANISNSIFNTVSFVGCKMVGLRFETSDPLLLSIHFEGCNLSFASFYGMELPQTVFTNCKMHQVDFSETHLRGSSFPETDLENAIFDQTDLEQVDFVSAFNFNIDPSKNKVRKAKFSKEGLIGLLKKYDIAVT